MLALTFDALLPDGAMARKREGVRGARQGRKSAPEPGGGRRSRAWQARCWRNTTRCKNRCPGFKAHGQALQDIRSQCEWLLGREWIARTPYERLQHLPRYLKAISVRLEKLRANPARDAQQLAQLLPLQQQWQRRLAAQQGEPDPRLEDYGWLLQELRVSLFAQELKTPVIVSVKRLEKALESITR